MTDGERTRARPTGPPPSRLAENLGADHLHPDAPGELGAGGEFQRVSPPVQYVYVQPSPGPMFARPEKRNQWIGWFIVGLFIWPFLFVALKVYGDEQNAYAMAMDEYRQGVDPDWYWQGLKARPDAATEVAEVPGRAKSNHIFKTVMVALLVITAMTVLLYVAFQVWVVGPVTGGETTTIQDLGGGTLVWLTHTTN